MDNLVALSYFLKMGVGTHCNVLSKTSKKIWNYVLIKAITVMTEYSPYAFNKEVDFDSNVIKMHYDKSIWY